MPADGAASWGGCVVSLKYPWSGQAHPQPDPLRIRNREQLIEIVSTIVRDDLAIDENTIRALAAPIADPDDLEQVIAMAISELHGLHEGNLARFRLRLSELRRWRGSSP